MQSLTAGKAGVTDRAGLFVFQDMTDSDSISVMLPSYGETVIPVTGMDSIVVTVRSARRYSYLNSEGRSVIIEKDKIEPSTLLDVPALLKQRSCNSLYELLQGRVAGLDMTPSGSGGEVTANIRGQRSFMLSNEPMVVMDGMPIGTISEANAIVNVHDIKTIEVLKSASEYGVRGANGVILIKTK
ncbi:MAG: TonB-dependent receptor plug domain-containing protein [Bacteroidales bacterium]|nr:TonB-dependent receptor plug domain-containing protein [Bacteroidales bacterium]